MVYVLQHSTILEFWNNIDVSFNGYVNIFFTAPAAIALLCKIMELAHLF
jgi:hypothetical protein